MPGGPRYRTAFASGLVLGLLLAVGLCGAYRVRDVSSRRLAAAKELEGVTSEADAVLAWSEEMEVGTNAELERAGVERFLAQDRLREYAIFGGADSRRPGKAAATQAEWDLLSAVTRQRLADEQRAAIRNARDEFEAKLRETKERVGAARWTLEQTR